MTRLGSTFVSEDTDARGQVGPAGNDSTVPGPAGEDSTVPGPAGDDGIVASVVAGTNITVDNTDPANPIVASTATGSPTTTEGDIIQRGASADERLPIGTANQVLAVNAGATALEYIEPTAGGGGTTVVGGRFAPPLASDFPTWVNQQAATVTDDAFEGLLLSDLTTDTGADQFIMRVKTMPSGSWTATAKLKVGYVASQFNGCGLVMRDSGTDRNTIFRIFANSTDVTNIGITNNAGNTFNSHILLAKVVNPRFEWLRIVDDTVNFSFQISIDGINWHVVGTQARTAWLASPDQLGFFISPENDAPVQLTCSYYDDKDTPAVIVSPTNQLSTMSTGTPASATATGVAGTVLYDSSFFYICVATDTWHRTAHATWA